MTSEFNAERFEDALAAFVKFCQQVSDDYMRTNFPSNVFPLIGTSTPSARAGIQKFVRITSSAYQTSVHGFVRVADGAILYPAGWARPYFSKDRHPGKREEKTVRGTIYVPESWPACIGPHGVKTLDRR